MIRTKDTNQNTKWIKTEMKKIDERSLWNVVRSSSTTAIPDQMTIFLEHKSTYIQRYWYIWRIYYKWCSQQKHVITKLSILALRHKQSLHPPPYVAFHCHQLIQQNRARYLDLVWIAISTIQLVIKRVFIQRFIVPTMIKRENKVFIIHDVEKKNSLMEFTSCLLHLLLNNRSCPRIHGSTCRHHCTNTTGPRTLDIGIVTNRQHSHKSTRMIPTRPSRSTIATDKDLLPVSFLDDSGALDSGDDSHMQQCPRMISARNQTETKRETVHRPMRVTNIQSKLIQVGSSSVCTQNIQKHENNELSASLNKKIECMRYRMKNLGFHIVKKSLIDLP